MNLINAEKKIKDLSSKFEELNSLPSIEQLEKMHKRQTAKFHNTSEE